MDEIIVEHYFSKFAQIKWNEGWELLHIINKLIKFYFKEEELTSFICPNWFSSYFYIQGNQNNSVADYFFLIDILC